MKQRAYNVPLPPADRSFIAPVKTAVSASVLFSSTSDVSARAPHPTGKEWNDPLLDDRPGAGQIDPVLSSQIDENWNAMWDRLTTHVGVSVPHAVDFPKLMAQRQSLVQAVVLGRADLFDAAIAQGADPNSLVPVKHPNQLPGQAETFIALPVGVAAAMLYQRYEATARKEGVIGRPEVIAQAAAYRRIAQKLLFNEHEDLPTVKIGTAPDGVGTSLTFYAWGIENFAKPALPTAESRALGGMSLVRHNEPVNFALGSLLDKISGKLLADSRILPQEEGNKLLGHALSDDQALDSMAHLRRLEEGQAPLGLVASTGGPVSPGALSRSSKIALDYPSGPELNAGVYEATPKKPRPA